MKPQIQYKVLISCMTYNHAPYIEDAIRGFCMQRTSFPFVAMIFDDASTDGEPEVILRFLEDYFDMDNARREDNDEAQIIHAICKENPNCHFVVSLLKYNHYSKKLPKAGPVKDFYQVTPYRAICEGDDYWVSPEKLQKQIDFLDGHPEYSMCFHNAVEHFENSKVEDRQFSSITDKDYTDVDVMDHWIVPTASVVFKKEIYDTDLYKLVFNDIKPLFGDTPLFVCLAQIGKLRGMKDVMSVYRRQPTGAVYNNAFDDKKKREKILNDYFLIADAVGPHMKKVIIKKYLQYGYSYRQPKYVFKAFFNWPLDTLIEFFRGLWSLIRRR